MEENIKTFNACKPGDIFYAINNDNILSFYIDHIDLLEAYGSIYTFRIYFKFVNSNELLYFDLGVKYMSKTDIVLRYVFNKSHDIYNKNYPKYLFGTNRTRLINYYTEQLQKSIDYQQDVVNKGLSQINDLQNKIKDFNKLLENL